MSSTGCDDWFAIGKSSPHNCDLNLTKFAYKVVYGQEGNCTGKNYYCSCSGLDTKPEVQVFLSNPSLTQNLISLDELQGGYYCNIEISRSEFPAMDNFALPILYSCEPDPTAC